MHVPPGIRVGHLPGGKGVRLRPLAGARSGGGEICRADLGMSAIGHNASTDEAAYAAHVERENHASLEILDAVAACGRPAEKTDRHAHKIDQQVDSAIQDIDASGELLRPISFSRAMSLSRREIPTDLKAKIGEPDDPWKRWAEIEAEGRAEMHAEVISVQQLHHLQTLNQANVLIGCIAGFLVAGGLVFLLSVLGHLHFT